MAKPSLTLVPSSSPLDMFEDLIEGENMLEDDDEYDEEEGEVEAVSLDDAVEELAENIKVAVAFMESELLPVWTEAEEFMNGESNVPKVEKRSKVTKTTVRDAVRALKPSALRVMMQSGKMAEYRAADPTNFIAAAIAEQQTAYTNQLFWKHDGYKITVNALHDTFVNRGAIVKVTETKKRCVSYVTLSNVSQDQLAALEQMEDVKIISAEESGTKTVMAPPQMPPEGVDPATIDPAMMQPQPTVTALLRVQVQYFKEQGAPKMQGINLLNFFVDEAATCPKDAAVIGERTSVTVGEARKMGLEYDGDWSELDDYDVEQDTGEQMSALRRRYSKNGGQRSNVDPSKHRFLLTECYAEYDLMGTGIPQVYRFWLGGTAYKYIHHELVEEVPYDVWVADPVPGSFFGTSVFDVLKEDQNTQTSLLRATCDNAHLSNNVRLAVHDQLVNMHDVVNPVLGAPIRVKAAGQIQPIAVDSTLGSMLPLLQYLDSESDNKIGVTNASMGLDPDALQSTGKEAVMNTIQLALSQVEFAVRNLVESGVRGTMTKMLKIAIRNQPEKQVTQINGQYVPVNTAFFDPEMQFDTAVGLGAGNEMMKAATLDGIIARQEGLVAQFGIANPIAGMDKLFNAITDRAALGGVHNIARYFTPITQDVAEQMQQRQEQMAAAQQGEQPSAAVIAAETIRAEARTKEQVLENQFENNRIDRESRLKLIELMMTDDRLRDEMVQKLGLETAKIEGQQVNQAAILAAQNKDREYKHQKDMVSQIGGLEQQRTSTDMAQNELVKQQIMQELQKMQQEMLQQQQMEAMQQQQQMPPQAPPM